MYIKEINITGFKSYKDITTIRDLSPKHNVVIGRNGSGKSNFFAAIQFVLSSEFTSITQHNRHAFLHESVGAKSATARVEIVFDNMDHRIPTESEEVRIVRTLTMKNDTYSIDGKSVTKTEIVNMMESAGFSRSNPYYIVKQGKITELATASDAYRLKLIKEVAGTRVFDEKKEESTKILTETQGKIEKSVTLLGYINERLKKLEEEKEDLKEYQKWDKMKRSIEYTIFDKEITEAKAKLEKLTDQRTKINTEQNKIGIERAIAERQAQLDELQPRYQKLLEEESSKDSDIRIMDQRCKELYAKQGHPEQFRTVAERDKHLKTELQWIDRQSYEMKNQIEEIKKSIRADEEEKETLGQRLRQEKILLEDLSIKMNKLSQEIKHKKEQLNKAITRRMDDSHLEKEKREKLTMLQYDVNRMEEDFRRLTPKATMSGITSIKTILDEYKHKRIFPEVVNGYYGRLIDLFNCTPEFNKAIEVTAESRLFYHVVEDDKVAMKLLESVNERSLPGEFNFYPLNRILDTQPREIIDKEARPLIECLQFDQKFNNVFKMVFKDYALVPRLDVGTRVARNEAFNCVTMDGDQISHRGPLTGGYMDVKRLKLDLVRRLKNAENDKNDLEKEIDCLTEKISASLNVVDQIRLEIAKRETEIQTLNNGYHDCLAKKQITSELLNKLSNNADNEPKMAQITKLKNRLKELTAQKESVNNQLKTPLEAGLTEAERDKINKMEDDIKKGKDDLDELRKERADLGNRIQTINNELQHKLFKKREHLNALIESNAGEKSNRLDTEQAEIKLIYERVKKLLDIIGVLDFNIEEYSKKKAELTTFLEKSQEKQKELEKSLEEFAKNAEIFCTKIANIQSKREEYSKKIKEIGPLPADAHGTYDKLPLKQLDKRLTEAMNHLKKYENVNKKACEQFIQAASQKDDLSRRVNELQKNEQAIKDLLTVLENRRYETLHLTFKQVAKYFSEVFRKLIPNGSANLIMQTLEKSLSTRSTTTLSHSTTMQSGAETETTIGEQSSMPERVLHELETFVGTSIKVSFTGGTETRDITSLSGGQKTLVALALIFAIQKCDPAPFYLFDEIDAALDQEHRRAIAEMIHDLSQTAQFITTTFRAELLEHAEKFYGVRVRDKVSYIDEIAKASAFDFVQDDQAHT
uniref:Structural maintenance of chromosomes protein 3 n=3 Tax=Meloidogyne TaxID=189290 RepID=A0A914KU80_MELIC